MLRVAFDISKYGHLPALHTDPPCYLATRYKILKELGLLAVPQTLAPLKRKAAVPYEKWIFKANANNIDLKNNPHIHVVLSGLLALFNQCKLQCQTFCDSDVV